MFVKEVPGENRVGAVGEGRVARVHSVEAAVRDKRPHIHLLHPMVAGSHTVHRVVEGAAAEVVAEAAVDGNHKAIS